MWIHTLLKNAGLQGNGPVYTGPFHSCQLESVTHIVASQHFGPHNVCEGAKDSALLKMLMLKHGRRAALPAARLLVSTNSQQWGIMCGLTIAMLFTSDFTSLIFCRDQAFASLQLR